MVAGFRKVAWLPVATFVLATFFFMPSPLLGQSTYGAVDMIELGSPYRDAIGRPPELVSPVQLDHLEEFPWAQSFFNSIRRGEWPSWDPNAGAGAPSGTIPLKGILSPFSAGFLVLPGWYALGLKVALTLLFCQAFTYLLVRRLGAGPAAATLAGLAYTFSGVNIVFIHRVSAQMVLPAMLWAAHRLLEKPSFRRVAPLAVFVAWGWFEGFPSGFVYCVYLTAAWCAWLLLHPWRIDIKRTLVKGLYVSAAFVLGLALAAINLIPFITEVIQRGILERREYGAASHLPSIQFFGLFDLDAIGQYPDGVWWSGMNPVESISHFGMIVGAGMAMALLAAILGRVRLTGDGRVAWSFFCGLAVVGLILNFAGGPLLAAAYEVPGIANNLITRTRFILSLSAVIVAALGLDSLWTAWAAQPKVRRFRRRNLDLPPEVPQTVPAPDGPARQPAPRIIPGLTLLAFAAMAIAYFPEYRLIAAANRQGDIVLRSVGRNLLLTLAAVLIGAVAWRRKQWAPFAAAGLAVLLFFQLAWPLRNFTPSAPVGAYYSVQKGHLALKKLLGGEHRFAAAGRFAYSLNSGQVHGIPDLRGMALPSEEFRALGHALSPLAFSDATLGILIPRDAWNLASPLLDDLAVGIFALGTDEKPFGVPAHQDPAWERWTPASRAMQAASFAATGPITGIALPVKGNQACARGRMTLSLDSGGRKVAESSRPSFDVLSNWLHYGLHQEQLRTSDWYWFAIDGQGLKAGDQYQLSLDASSPDCDLEVGTLGTEREMRPARHVLAPDPAYPLRLVSTEQSWIYERPTAWELVSAHSRWKAFDDQPAALAYSAHRPESDRDLVAYVGRQVPVEPEAAAAKVSRVRWRSDNVSFSTSGDARSLVVVSQNADNGWTARVDGTPTEIVKVDGVLAGVFVPAGNHRVRLDYRPDAFIYSAWISGVAALILLAVSIPARRRSRDPR